MILSVIVALLIVAGAGFMLLAGFGVLRMPDLFLRMHASTKGASLGVAFLLLAAALDFRDPAVATKAVLASLFIFITAPVAAHMLGRAAYAKKVALWEKSVLDEGRGRIAATDESEKQKRSCSQDS